MAVDEQKAAAAVRVLTGPRNSAFDQFVACNAGTGASNRSEKIAVSGILVRSAHQNYLSGGSGYPGDFISGSDACVAALFEMYETIEHATDSVKVVRRRSVHHGTFEHFTLRYSCPQVTLRMDAQIRIQQAVD